MLPKAVFLDRDGVINYPVIRNRKPYPPSCLDELKIYPDVLQFLKLMKKKGFYLIVITNQPDVSRGTISINKVRSINNYLIKNFPLDEIKVCFHDDRDRCYFRKPSPGALLSSSISYNLSLAHSYMIGDRWKDISAGEKAGCKTIYIDRNYNEKKPKTYSYKTDSLKGAGDFIIKDMELFRE